MTAEEYLQSQIGFAFREGNAKEYARLFAIEQLEEVNRACIKILQDNPRDTEQKDAYNAKLAWEQTIWHKTIERIKSGLHEKG